MSPVDKPTRQDAAGRAYLDLRRAARINARPTDEYLRLYVLEAFLARLAASEHVNKLILKGGVLLAAYSIRRPTADVDVAAQDVPGQTEWIRDLVKSIAERPAEDGVVFDTSVIQAEQIRDEDQYSGVRVALTATLATARIRFHVDVNIGDPIWPRPEQVHLPRLLGGQIEVRGYPLAMVLAEKIVTALERGSANTRWRDFADIYLLTNRHNIQADVVIKAIRTVADHRNVRVQSLRSVLDGFEHLAQPKWVAWRRRQKLSGIVPEQFAELLTAVYVFADELNEPPSAGRVWDRDIVRWTND